MERESNPMPMCRSGCGFYGNPAQDGLCSVCFKDALRKKQAPPVGSTPVSASSPVNSSTQTINPSTAVSVPLLSNQSTPTHVDHNTAQPTVLLHNNLSSSADKDIDCAHAMTSKAEDDNTNRKRPSSMQDTSSDEDKTKKKRVSLIGESKKPSTKKISKRLSNGSSSSRRSLSKKSLSDEGADGAGPSNLDDDKDGDKDAKKKKNRCVTCRKKVGLTGFECRCGGLFCAIHRYSDKHECSFDYREHGAAEIRRNNPVVVGEKIQKI